ncbi:MAG: site-specific DNA-methyltransferase, partial [Candidatus Heimdallarchaeota archaeon]|nr:site-specific DNA-methyltransferase [Candidatus Heimdallarchaeota archaeon]MCK4610133.1 site-specific DNA-methyltransferase [Candidatus Heimdallarchaeota archaeon]
MKTNHIYQGDALEVLRTFPDECVDTIITSPPYWSLRDYGIEGQLGLEPTFQEHIFNILQVTAELKRVLKNTGV